jgi:hypothetical protein
MQDAPPNYVLILYEKQMLQTQMLARSSRVFEFGGDNPYCGDRVIRNKYKGNNHGAFCGLAIWCVRMISQMKMGNKRMISLSKSNLLD